MRALLTEDQRLIIETAAKLVRGAGERARAVLNGAVIPPEPSSNLMSDWSGLGIAEGAGGMGGTLVDAALLVHELGQAVEPTAFTAHFMAAHAFHGAGGDMSPILADGARATIAWQAGEQAPLVAAFGQNADMVVHGNGDMLLLSEIVSTEACRSIDPLKPVARVVPGKALARAPRAACGWARTRTLGAAELCGIGRGAVRLAVGHASTREQFGKPIGAYQAIGHRLAQVTADLEAAWSLTLYAAWALGDNETGAEQSARMAKAAAGDAAVAAAEACVQTHGGMGITREADPHLFLKKAFAVDGSFGSSAEMNFELARQLF